MIDRQTGFPTRLVAALLAPVLLLAPTAAAYHDSCAGGSDAGDHVYDAFPLVRGSTCSGAMDGYYPTYVTGGGNDATDWYFVHEPLLAGSRAISIRVCSTVASTPPVAPGLTTIFAYLYFVPGAALVPWTGVTAKGAPPAPDPMSRFQVDEEWAGGAYTSAGDGDCGTVSATADPAASGRWYLRLNANYLAGYTLTAS